MSWLEQIDSSTDDFAHFYDEVSLWSAPFGLLLLSQIPLRSGMQVVDVGAGTGFLSIELAQRCGDSAHVVAVDPWAAALRKLEARSAYLGLENIRVVEARIEEASLPSDSFDLLVSNLGINNFGDPRRALSECHRILRPGGELAFTTNTRGHMAEFYEIYRSVLASLDLSGLVPVLDEHIETRTTEESIVALLGEAGFRIDHLVRDQFSMRFADGSSFLRHFFVRLAFLPEWMRVCPNARLGEVFMQLEVSLNELAEKNGVLSLTIPMLCVRASSGGIP